MISIPLYFAQSSQSNWFNNAYVLITVVSLFWSLYGGTLIDKYNRKKIFLCLNLVNGLAIGSIAYLESTTTGYTNYMAAMVFAMTFWNYNLHYPCFYAFMQEITEKEHYDKIAEVYQDHYFDKESRYYRSKIQVERFKKYLEGSKDILDIGCGDGSFIEILIDNKILDKNYFGLDVSFKNTQLFNKKFKSRYAIFKEDFTKKNLNLGKKFDIIFCIGAIHHMYLEIDNVFENLFNHLNKNGKIIIVEPNGSFLNGIRNYWYKKDKYFDSDSERALPIKEIDKVANRRFEKIFYEYHGFIGYFIILQSMILRTPKFIKKKTYKFFTFIDKLFSKLNSKFLSPSYSIIYKKKD